MALEENRKHIFDDSLLTENLQIVRQVSGFYPLTERELFEAAAISMPDRPRLGAAEHVNEVIRFQETRGYAERRHRNVGAALVREYARYFRSSTTLLEKLSALQEVGVHALKVVDAPLIDGARVVVQFCDIAAFQRGDKVAVSPLVTSYLGKSDQIKDYVTQRIMAMPARELVHVTEETHEHISARRSFWGNSLVAIGDQVADLQTHVESVFRLSPLERR